MENTQIRKSYKLRLDTRKISETDNYANAFGLLGLGTSFLKQAYGREQARPYIQDFQKDAIKCETYKSLCDLMKENFGLVVVKEFEVAEAYDLD